jgi:hypothetical protein
MDKNIAQVLEECLERSLVSGESLEQCLRKYPELAEQLEPLLRTALELTGAMSQHPRPVFRAQVKAQFRPLAEISLRRKIFPALIWRHQFATVGLGLLLFLVLGGGTIVAAEHGTPDSPLYQVKLASEQARLMLANSEDDKMELNVGFVDRRVDELSYALEKGSPEKIEEVVHNLDRNLNGLSAVTEAGYAPAAPFESYERHSLESWEKEYERRYFLRWYAKVHNDELRQLFIKAPPSAQTPMLYALRRAWVSYRHALEAVGENPDVISD